MIIHSAPHESQQRSSRRYVRDSAHRTDYPLHHIACGVEILSACDQLGFVTHGQITRLLFANTPNQHGQDRSYRAAERASCVAFQRLWCSEFLDRQPVMLTSKRTGFGYHHFVNTLTAKGAKALQLHFDATGQGSLRWTRRGIKVSNQTVEHSLAINDFYVLAKRAAQLHDIGLHDWLDDRQLTAMKLSYRLKLVSIPDAFFVLSHKDRFNGHFLEIDTGSETVIGRRSPRSWTKTIADYGQYFRDYYHNDGYFKGFTAPIVLTVTSNPTRMDNLLAATRRAGGAGVYWYTTAEKLSPVTDISPTGKASRFDPSVLWHPIWRVVNDPTPRSLLDRLSQVHTGV